MTELWIALCVGLPIGLGVVAFALHERRAERARCNAPTLSPTGRVALVGTPSLDALEHNPQAADALRGRVRSIYVMSLPTFTAGAQASNSVLNETGLFFIDIEGALLSLIHI